MTKDEALDLALEALIYASSYCDTYDAIDAITAIKQARALDKMADNARELGLDYEPVQEPVASIFISGIGEREFDDWGHDLPVGRNLLYTSPPASKPLTGEQIRALWEQEAKPERSTAHFFTAFARAIETAHGIKENT